MSKQKPAPKKPPARYLKTETQTGQLPPDPRAPKPEDKPAAIRHRTARGKFKAPPNVSLQR